MIENLKTKIWDLLKKKEVSLAMIFSRDGEILWHRGRDIVGKKIADGKGFSKSCLKQCMTGCRVMEEEDVVVTSQVNHLPASALLLNLKSIMILPVGKNFFLYLDSGINDSFSGTDREVFRVLGELLGELIECLRARQEDTGGITGSSPEIRKIRELVLKYSLEEDPVLLRGDTGCGKNHIAELIHRFSGRKGKFVTINTPGIPENLFESEVFGHKKGAFTGAGTDKKGLVEEAAGGTLFFDEIAEVPPTFQARLLRFMETKKYYILGDTGEKTADVRIVAATNKDLAKAIEERRFREDLYYRLQVLEIKIPPLRERLQDLETLVREEQRHLKGKTPGPGFWEVARAYHWPGNIRELKSVLKRAGILNEDSVITGPDLKDIIHQNPMNSSNDNNGVDGIWAEFRSGKNFWAAVKEPFLERNLNRDQVKEVINKGLAEAGGKYKDLLPLFNLEPADYHRFMSFLNDYGIR